MIDLNKLIRFIELKKKEGINDNAARVILYLGAVGEDSFQSMLQKQVFPKGTRNFRDLSQKMGDLLVTNRRDHPLQYYAKLTPEGKRIYKELSKV